MTIRWSQALAWRMRRHLLEPVGTQSVAEVVERLGAVPALDEGLAELAVRARREQSQKGEVARALADGRIIKSFAFRGATHYLSVEDAGAYLALRAALVDGPLTVTELGAAVSRKAAYRHLGQFSKTVPAR